MRDVISCSGGESKQIYNAKLREEDGIGVVEVILILVVLIGLVIIFKSQLTSLVQNIFSKIVSESSGI